MKSVRVLPRRWASPTSNSFRPCRSKAVPARRKTWRKQSPSWCHHALPTSPATTCSSAVASAHWPPWNHHPAGGDDLAAGPVAKPLTKQKSKHDEQDSCNRRERRHWQKDAPASAEIEADQPTGRPGALGRCCVAFSRQKEVDRRTAGVDSPVYIDPLALDPDVGFVHSPTVVGRSEPRAQTSFHFWGIPLDPTPHHDVLGVQTSLREQLFHIPIRQGKTQIPTNRQKDDFRFEVPPLEQTGNR